jgi:hypothetical protein
VVAFLRNFKNARIRDGVERVALFPSTDPMPHGKVITYVEDGE